MKKCDILIVGSGYFAEIMANDLAAVASMNTRVAIAGRNKARIEWLEAAGNARAAIFGRPVQFSSHQIELDGTQALTSLLQELAPKVVVHAASLQSPWSVDSAGSAWSRLVNDAGFGITLPFHATLPARTAQAIVDSGIDAALVNTCYPDGVNAVLKAAGLPIVCGVGNIAIFSSVVAGTFPLQERERIRVLAHHNHLVQWRRPGAERGGIPIRVWRDEEELLGIQDALRHIQLPFRDLNVVSGASAVPVLLALCGQLDLRAHVPGPFGLPGGYPVKIRKGVLSLDLPEAVSREQAIAWNRQFDDADGVSVHDNGDVRFSPRARAEIARHSAELACGFHVSDLDGAREAWQQLRTRLQG